MTAISQSHVGCHVNYMFNILTSRQVAPQKQCTCHLTQVTEGQAVAPSLGMRRLACVTEARPSRIHSVSSGITGNALSGSMQGFNNSACRGTGLFRWRREAIKMRVTAVMMLCTPAVTTPCVTETCSGIHSHWHMEM